MVPSTQYPASSGLHRSGCGHDVQGALLARSIAMVPFLHRHARVGPSESFPTGHVSHDEPPPPSRVSVVEPTGQSTHWDTTVLPASLAYLPGAQAVQFWEYPSPY